MCKYIFLPHGAHVLIMRTHNKCSGWGKTNQTESGKCFKERFKKLTERESVTDGWGRGVKYSLMSEVLSFNKSDIWAERLWGEREIAMRLAQGGAFQAEGTTRGKALMYTFTRRFWKWCGSLGNWIQWKEMSRRGMEAFLAFVMTSLLWVSWKAIRGFWAEEGVDLIKRIWRFSFCRDSISDYIYLRTHFKKKKVLSNLIFGNVIKTYDQVTTFLKLGPLSGSWRGSVAEEGPWS